MQRFVEMYPLGGRATRSKAHRPFGLGSTRLDLSSVATNGSFGPNSPNSCATPSCGKNSSRRKWSSSTFATQPEFDIGLYFHVGTPSDPRVAEFRRVIEQTYVAYYNLFDDHADFELKLRHKLMVLLTKHAEKKKTKPEVIGFEVVKLFNSSPLSVATYPKTLPGGEELSRPELQTLLEKIESTESSATVVLGERGSGKSALFAALDLKLRSNGNAVLSIKADMLGTEVRDEVAFDQALHLPLGFAASVQLVATQRPVVVIVDQLDALADVLDRRTERLNVVLNAIHAVSAVRNVHIIVSSRPFEYQHDPRLRAMATEQLDLELPPWPEVAPILEKNGYPPDLIAEPVRQLLRNPWTLNEFLRLRPAEVSFLSMFALLEEVWVATVEASDAPLGTSELVNALVTTMRNDEVLWVPRVIAGPHEAPRQYLLKRGIIQLDDSQLRVAFRHQSFFEFALARRFAAGGESFTRYVLDGSQSLFVRPVVVAGLAYIRGTVSSRYEKELETLWEAPPRAHLRALILDFIAGQSSPLPTEVAIITRMLADDRSGARALAAIASNEAWFPILRPTAAFVGWLRRPPAEAIHATRVIARRAASAPDDVLELLEREWLNQPAYDHLSFSVLYNIASWSERALDFILRIVQRSEQSGVYDLAQQMIENTPHFAARLLRVELDRRLSVILESGSDGYEQKHAIELLLEEEEHTDVFGDLAETSPVAFVTSLLPWVVRTLETASDERDRYQQYRRTWIGLNPVGMKPVASLLAAAIGALESIANDPDAALATISPYFESESMGVHALLARVLTHVAAARPTAVMEYLLRDTRRLAIGNWGRSHQYSKLIIEAVLPHAQTGDVRSLEAAVLAYDYFIAPDEDLTAEQLSRKAPWNREHRLFLLQSIAGDYLSEEGLQRKHELEAEFPGLDETIFGQIRGGVVEAPYDLAALESRSDNEIVAIFDELTDDTGWDHPRRWEGDRLIGGSIQQSRVFGELAERNPERVFQLVRKFRPHDQELPVAHAISGLAKTDLDPQRLVGLILDLADMGFGSEVFITSAARALDGASGKLIGLPDPVIELLSLWINSLPTPSISDARESSDTLADHPVVFGPGGLFIEPDGRGPVIEAIAAGYLDRDPPDIESWVAAVRTRLQLEQHPAVWVVTLRNLQDVIRHDAAIGTELFGGVFERHPSVLREPLVLLLVAHWMGGFTPHDAVLSWLDRLSAHSDPRSQQAFGELLYLYVTRHPESQDRVHRTLKDCASPYVVRGLAYAAGYLWGNVSTRSLGLDVFTNQIERWPADAAKTLNSLIVANRGELELDELTQKVFRKAATNEAILIDIFSELGEEIEPRTIQEPAFVADIARAFVAVPTPQLESPTSPINRGLVPEVVTNIALTLHRIPAFAEVGLELFEKLLDANLREAKAATELLDRKPSRVFSSLHRRRRRARRPRR